MRVEKKPHTEFLLAPLLATIGYSFSELKDSFGINNSKVQIVYDKNNYPYVLFAETSPNKASKTAKNLGFTLGGGGFIRTNLKDIRHENYKYKCNERTKLLVCSKT